ncbi:MAG: hypothetical protein LBV76_03920 [Deltaproteobacteria bacterium]|nr:hypothetical protein [Deltaproteobacteria bacterium]
MTDLFTAPDEILRQRLGQVKNAVAFAFPQKRQHREDLPYAVRDLSRLLTTERAQKNSYWAAPRLLGAYLHYFLPWNLFRLSWLLPGLPLNLKTGDRILDLGSGPLTLPLAFRLCRPQDAILPLTWFCSDLTPHPMEVGKDIFKQCGALMSPELKTAAPPWRLNLLRAPLELALRKAKGRVNLITALNVLNELPAPRQDSLEESLGSLFSSMDRALEPGGMILLIEPGTRLGGKIVQLMRYAAMARGYEVLSPCTHNAACPFYPLAGSAIWRNTAPRPGVILVMPVQERRKNCRNSALRQDYPRGVCIFRLCCCTSVARNPAVKVRLPAIPRSRSRSPARKCSRSEWFPI